MRLFFVFALLFAGINFTNAQTDPLTADTVIYIQQANGNYKIIAGQVFADVLPENKVKFERQRIKRKLDNLAQLEAEIKRQKSKILADSAAIAGNLTGINPNDLFADDLPGLVGEWRLEIGNKSDKIIIDSLGAFTSVKSGSGTITILAENAKKIEVVLAGKKMPLQRQDNDVFANDKLSVTLTRIKSENKNRNR